MRNQRGRASPWSSYSYTGGWETAHVGHLGADAAQNTIAPRFRSRSIGYDFHAPILIE